ncbi:MAG: HipA N-terminal domain-containing protein [Bacilli bacterium]|nr:HipA N-terminal domain-containing protein [Bacilli bacterium]
MPNIKSLYLNVYYRDILVGRLEQEQDGLVSFEYDEKYLSSPKSFSISPFSLPLKKGKFLPKDMRFEGLFGVFYECLPTSFSKTLLKKHLAKAGVDYDSLTPLTKLSLLLPNHFGALSFSPGRFDVKRYPGDLNGEQINLDEYRKRCFSFLEGKEEITTKDIALLGMGKGNYASLTYLLNGSYWDARLYLDRTIITEGQDEYDLYKAARKCEIITPTTLLSFSKLSQGNFTYKRIDRDKKDKLHCLSLRSILELQSFSSIDYLSVLETIYKLTHDEYQMYEMLRRITFIVALGLNSYSPDDIFFTYNEYKESYELAPFFNIKPPTDFYEHQISTNWKGHPRKEDIAEIAMKAGLSYHESMDIIESVWKIAIKG